MSSYATLLVKAAAVHTLVPGEPTARSIMAIGDRIAAVSTHRDGLDGSIDPDTVVIERPDGVVLPSFDDTHTHLVFAASGVHDVPVHLATNIPEMLDIIRESAHKTPAGRWLRTTANWQEINLREERFPTADELDSATTEHPVLLMRGGHNVVLNHLGLELAGITEDMPDPAGGHIGRDGDGRLNGWLQDNAATPVFGLPEEPTIEDRLEGFRAASLDYAAKGVGLVRDCFVPIGDLDVIQRALHDGLLNVRVRALVTTAGFTTAEQVEELLDQMERWRYRADPWLSVWGLKFVFDGGIEAASTREPYACDHSMFGTLTWDVDKLLEAMDHVVRRGWRLGTHAYGDNAVEKLLDVYAELIRRHPQLPPNSLVMEHGGFADADLQERAAQLHVPVTIQQPLQHDAAKIQDTFWGPERVDALFPARGWIDRGVLVSGGSDYPVGRYGAMQSVWGMVTRQTVTGVRGPEHAITAAEAITLHTTNAAALTGESERRGMLTPGRFADLTIWDVDPTTAESDRLHGLEPTHTIIGGRVVHQKVD